MLHHLPAWMVKAKRVDVSYTATVSRIMVMPHQLRDSAIKSGKGGISLTFS